MPGRSSDVAAILDVDGTLVDTNYQHALAWYRAFRGAGVIVPVWRIHRHVGMGSDRFVAAVAGDGVEREHGDDLRTAHDALYMSTIDEVSVLPGATELLRELRARGHAIVLASSARQEELDRYLELLGGRDVADDWTVAADVKESKPAPDIVRAALEKAHAERGVMVGDSTWDCLAARNAGVNSVGLLSGGFSEQELTEAGAAVVVHDTGELARRLDDTPLA